MPVRTSAICEHRFALAETVVALPIPSSLRDQPPGKDDHLRGWSLLCRSQCGLLDGSVLWLYSDQVLLVSPEHED